MIARLAASLAGLVFLLAGGCRLPDWQSAGSPENGDAGPQVVWRSEPIDPPVPSLREPEATSLPPEPAPTSPPPEPPPASPPSEPAESATGATERAPLPEPEPVGTASETPVENAASPAPAADTGLVPTFEAPRPERRSMPVPVFPESVDFAEVVPGWVDLRVTIGLSGEVLEAEVLEASHPALADPARVALEQARYRVVRDPVGRPVQVTIRERIEF